ncbi:MAG: histidine kinase dimerization/phospho-acceptor domain-containing protein [bacterium]
MIKGKRIRPQPQKRKRDIGGKNVQQHLLKDAELRHQKNKELIGHLMPGIIHNINSPLAAISMTAEVLRMKYPDQEELEDILHAVSRIGDIISNLMMKCLREQTKEPGKVDLNELIHLETNFLKANLVFKHEVESELDLQPNLPAVWGRYGDFSLCFYSLLMNLLCSLDNVEYRRLMLQTRYDRTAKKVHLVIKLSSLDSTGEQREESLAKIMSEGETAADSSVLYREVVRALLENNGVELQTPSERYPNHELRLVFSTSAKRR